MQPEFTSSGKHIAITGARGRLAPLVAGRLEALGWNVIRYSREPSTGVSSWADLLEGRGVAPDIILHCAWSCLPMTAEQHPDLPCHEDIPALKRMLATHTQSRLIFLSTAAVYGNTGPEPAKESTPPSPLGAYARGKLAAENMLMSHAPDRSLALRISNLLGHASDPARPQGVLPRLIACAKSGSPFEMWARTEGKKDYLDTGDFLDALDRLIGKKSTGIINMASGRSHSLPELISAVEELTGRQITVAHREPYPWDVVTSHIDNSKLRSLIDWSPRHELADSIRANIESAG